MAQRAERHALADDRGGLGGAAIERLAARRAAPAPGSARCRGDRRRRRRRRAGAARGRAIAVGAVHAGVGDRRRNVAELCRQRVGVLGAERRQLDDAERDAQPAGAPRRVGTDASRRAVTMTRAAQSAAVSSTVARRSRVAASAQCTSSTTTSCGRSLGGADEEGGDTAARLSARPARRGSATARSGAGGGRRASRTRSRAGAARAGDRARGRSPRRRGRADRRAPADRATADERRLEVLAAADADVEQRGAVHGEAARLGAARGLLDQARLADAGVAADEKSLPAALLGAGLQRGVEQPQPPAGRRTGRRRPSRRARRRRASAPRRCARSAASRHRALHRRGDEDLPGCRRGLQRRGLAERRPGDDARRPLGAAHDHHLPAGEADAQRDAGARRPAPARRAPRARYRGCARAECRTRR